MLACVASVSAGFSAARSRRFSLFGGAKIGRAQKKSEKCFKPAESPTETLATQAIKMQGFPVITDDKDICVALHNNATAVTYSILLTLLPLCERLFLI